MPDSIEKQFITAFSESWGELGSQMLARASSLGLLALREVSGDGVEAALAVAATWSWGFFTECLGALPGVAICLFKSEDGEQLEKLAKQDTDGLPKPGSRALLKSVFAGAAKRLSAGGNAVNCGEVTYLELSGQEKRLSAVVGNKAWVGTFALSIGDDSDTQALMLYAPNGSIKALATTAPTVEQAAAVASAASAPSNNPGASAPTPSRRAPRREEPTVRNIERLLGMELEVIVRFGTTNLPLREVVRLGPGMMIELNRAVDEPVELLVNGRSMARGEVVVIDGYYGVRITEIGTPAERPLSLIPGSSL